MKTELIIIGASGHGKVVADLAEKCGYLVKGFLDDNPKIEEHFGYPVLGEVRQVERFDKCTKNCRFVIAIGNNAIRKKIAQTYKVHWTVLIHPGAVVARGVSIGEGTVVMANAVVNPDTVIGKHCIVNTAAVVEHDNCIGDYSHISPGAVLAGTVTIGRECHIGAGAVVRNNLTIADQCILGAGAAAVKELTVPGIYVGIPAKRQ